MWNLNRTQGVGIGVAVFLGSSQFLRLQVAKVFWERRKVSPGNGKGKSGESCKGKLWNIGCAGTPKLHFVVLSATTGWEGKTHESMPYGMGSTANSEISLLALLDILNFILRGRTNKKKRFSTKSRNEAFNT